MHKRWAAIIGLLVLVFLPLNANAAETGTTKFSVDLNQPVLELTVPTNPAVINLEPVATGDSFGSTNIAIRVATNNITGYTLTMNPSNNVDNTSLIRTELLTEESTYRTIGTLAQTDPVSAGYTEQSFTANKWGYKITGDNYYGIDPNNTTVSHPAWVGNDPTNGTNHNLTLGVKINANTVSGSYETTLNFHAVTNSTIAKHTLSFNANGGTGTMNTVAITAGDSAALPANTFTPPTGMRFVGWATTQNGQGEGVRYYDDEATYTAIDIGYNVNLTLYAQWTDENTPTQQGGSSGTTPGTTLQRAYEIAYTAMHKGMYEEVNPGSNTYTYINSWNGGQYQGNGRDVRFLIQDMTPEICASATAMDSEALVLDIRDQKSYWIAKLKDGNCWMTQNLDFNITSTLSSETTDLTDYGRYSYIPAEGYSKNGDIIYWTPDNTTLDGPSTIGNSGYFSGWTYSSSAPDSVDPGDWYWSGSYSSTSISGKSYLLSAKLGETGNANFAQSPFVTNGLHGHVGNYYNYPAAVASNDASLHTDYDTDNDPNPDYSPQNSICPAHWRLPMDLPKNEFSALISKYYFTGGHTDDEYVLVAPLFFTRTGLVSSGRIVDDGSYGYYYTNNNGTYGATNIFIFSGGYIYTSYSYFRDYGMTLRCLAR